MDNPEIQFCLRALGEQVPAHSRLIVIGGSALALLGSPRLTIDIDFIGDDVLPSKLDRIIIEAGRQLGILVEPVPLERFIPLPEGSPERNLRIGQYGNLEVFVADPYSIALSKVDRGLDTDIDDILFLVRRRFIDWNELERLTRIALERADEFDLDRAEMLAHLETIRIRLA